MALGAEDCAFRHGYSLLLCNSRQDLARELTYISSLTAFPVDGLILGSGSISEQHLHDYTQNGTPVVIIDRQIENVQADAILSDHFQGAKGAVEHLIELGHRRIAIITGPMDLRPAIDRMRGYQSALREHAIESRPEFICEGDFQVNSGREAAAVLFNLADPPSAIFASNDLMAIGVLDAARKLGLQAPQDFSLVGFDDIFLASLVQPPLTTVAQPAYRLGELAVERLFKRIGSVERLEPQEFCLSTDLIIRESARRI
jgi:LacI family transcriptional regulator